MPAAGHMVTDGRSGSGPAEPSRRSGNTPVKAVSPGQSLDPPEAPVRSAVLTLLALCALADYGSPADSPTARSSATPAPAVALNPAASRRASTVGGEANDVGDRCCCRQRHAQGAKQRTGHSQGADVTTAACHAMVTVGPGARSVPLRLAGSVGPTSRRVKGTRPPRDDRGGAGVASAPVSETPGPPRGDAPLHRKTRLIVTAPLPRHN